METIIIVSGWIGYLANALSSKWIESLLHGHHVSQMLTGGIVRYIQ